MFHALERGRPNRKDLAVCVITIIASQFIIHAIAAVWLLAVQLEKVKLGMDDSIEIECYFYKFRIAKKELQSYQTVSNRSTIEEVPILASSLKRTKSSSLLINRSSVDDPCSNTAKKHRVCDCLKFTPSFIAYLLNPLPGRFE